MGTQLLRTRTCGFFFILVAGCSGASKHALEAVSESFRIELRAFGIEVIIVRPGKQ